MKNDTKELIHKTETDSKTSKPNLWLQRGNAWRGINWEVWIYMYTILYMEYISKKDLQHNRGKSTQYSVLIYMGKETEKEWTYV